MTIVPITLYATTVIGGVVQANSTLVTLYIDDVNKDGAIDRTEWSNYTGSPYGHIGGETYPPALFNGGTTGNVMNGTLYSPVAYVKGANVSTTLKAIDKSKYAPTITALSICYLAGTMIATPTGEVPVEKLQAGDLVLTRDHAAQPLIWTGATVFDRAALDRNPAMRPIRISAGALGHELPRKDVDVSPQHRVMITGPGGHEYLISARHLMMAGMPGVTLRPETDSFTLIHLACADHEMVLAEGAPMETLFCGKMALRSMSIMHQLGLIVARHAAGRADQVMTPARPFIKHRDFATMRQVLSA